MSYNSWKLNHLKCELKRRGASVRGKKNELIERLQAYDRNFDFGNVVLENENIAPKMVLPTPESYKDLHGGIILDVYVTKTHIEEYLNCYQQVITSKACQLFESRFIQYIKYSATANGVYFSCSVKAAMKKLVYIVDVFISGENTVEQCQCECAAGEGLQAHCKHIIAVLLAVETFCNKKIVNTAETCTEKLQTFHQPKTKFNLSPIKAKNLPLSTRTKNNFDPRPEQNQSNRWYQDYFRNLCINFGDCSMPILQLYEPANPYAIENDHQYCKTDIKSQLFQSMGLLNVSKEQITEIEVRTRGQRKNKMWHYERSFRITSTSFKDVCCATERRDKKSLANSLLNKRSFSTKATRHGVIYEEKAKTVYEEVKNIKIKECGLFVVPDYPYLAASPDGVIDGETIIEIKCSYSAKNKNVSLQTVPYLEIIDKKLNLKKNHTYYYQIMGQLLATGKQYCDLIIYTLCDHIIIQIERDQEFIDAMLINLQSFYDSHFCSALQQKYFYKDYSL